MKVKTIFKTSLS